MPNPHSRSFHLDLVNSPTFSEKLESFCLQAVNVGPRQHEFSAFKAHGFVLSEENLGLPLNNANINVTRCFFWRGSVKCNEQKFVVMTFSATTELNRSFFDDEPYEFTSRINELIRSMVVKSCEKVISAHVDALLSHISLCDGRFTTFHAAHTPQVGICCLSVGFWSRSSTTVADVAAATTRPKLSRASLSY